MTHLLALFIWLVFVVSLSQVLYITWRLWPFLCATGCTLRSAVYRKVHCPWCWNDLQVRRWYPMRWSSTMCVHHVRCQRAGLTARRQAREAIQRSAVCSEVAAMGTDQQLQEVVG
jgi:arylamine N-acetyltransferase